MGSAGVPERFAAVPVVFWLSVGISTAKIARKEYGPVPPLNGPARKEFCAAFDAVNVCAGVLVEVATEVVKSGDRLPELKLVTVPPPPPPA